MPEHGDFRYNRHSVCNSRSHTVTRRNPILCIAALICVLFPAKVQGDEPDTDAAARERHLQLLVAQSDLKMHELEVAVSMHAIEEAEVEVGKAKTNLSSIQMRARSGKDDEKDRIEFATLEVKQAQIRAEMKRLQSEMTQVQLELAKARFEYLKVSLSQTQRRKPLPVKFEVVDDLDAIVIRGSKEGVGKMKSLIERIKKK
jgi:hypothetical protein